MTSISLKLPPELEARLTRAARAQGVSKSRLIREALEAHLAAGKRRDTGLELIADLVGCFAGPKDLSTNPKYMKGFGE
jgi:metal-responsive CopG/Arc/MetJ family transcriptional regulator